MNVVVVVQDDLHGVLFERSIKPDKDEREAKLAWFRWICPVVASNCETEWFCSMTHEWPKRHHRLELGVLGIFYDSWAVVARIVERRSNQRLNLHFSKRQMPSRVGLSKGGVLLHGFPDND